jgi:rhodanese-related sulfurtransferase
MKLFHLILIVLPLSILAGALSALLVLNAYTPRREALIRDFYATENAVHVSPHGLRKKIAEGKLDVTLVDLRSAEEYEKEHIVGAVSIPAYRDKDHSAYDEADRIVAAFGALPQDKPIVVYCYSMPCMTGRKVGQMLAEKGIYVQHLGIGWNEWRHHWTLWNHEHEWSATEAAEYVAAGKEPGTFKGVPSMSPCIEGQFGC